MAGVVGRAGKWLPFVRMGGLEPPRLSTPDPKSGAAADYATSALFFAGAKVQFFHDFITFPTFKY